MKKKNSGSMMKTIFTTKQQLSKIQKTCSGDDY